MHSENRVSAASQSPQLLIINHKLFTHLLCELHSFIQTSCMDGFTEYNRTICSYLFINFRVTLMQQGLNNSDK